MRSVNFRERIPDSLQILRAYENPLVSLNKAGYFFPLFLKGGVRGLEGGVG